MNKKLMVMSFATIATLSVFSYAQANKVKAESAANFSPTVQRLVEKFQLNAAEVEIVVNQVHEERQAARMQEREQKLTELVTQNKITADQKTKLLAKIKEWQESRADWQALDKEAKQAKIQEHRTEMLNWAQENAIDAKYLIGLGEGQFFRGFTKGYRAGNSAN